MGKTNRLLCIGDDSSRRELVEALLIGQGYELMFVKDKDEAQSRVAEIDPDLIFSTLSI